MTFVRSFFIAFLTFDENTLSLAFCLLLRLGCWYCCSILFAQPVCVCVFCVCSRAFMSVRTYVCCELGLALLLNSFFSNLRVWVPI
jgi:hypothetical protein